MSHRWRPIFRWSLQFSFGSTQPLEKHCSLVVPLLLSWTNNICSGRLARRRSEWRWTRWGGFLAKEEKFKNNLKSILSVDGNSWKPALHSSKFCFSGQVAHSTYMWFGRLEDSIPALLSTKIALPYINTFFVLFLHNFAMVLLFIAFVKRKADTQGFNPGAAHNQNRSFVRAGGHLQQCAKMVRILSTCNIMRDKFCHDNEVLNIV